MKPLGKTQSSPPTGSDLNTLAFEHGDRWLLSGCAGKVGRQLLAPTRRRQLAQVQSILKEGKGGKLVKTPTQPCRKQRNLFCNVPVLSGSYAHHGTMSAGAQCEASGPARPYGHSPHTGLLQTASMAGPFAPGYSLASIVAAAHGGARCLSPLLPCHAPLEGKAACLGMQFQS